MEHHRITRAKALFFDATIAGGFRDFAEAAYSALGFPVLLIDNHYSILFQLPCSPIQHQLFDACLGVRQLPVDLCILHQKLLSSSADSRGISMVSSDEGGSFSAVFPIINEEKEVLAFLHLYPDAKHFSPEELEIIHLLCRMLSQKLQEMTRHHFVPTQQNLLNLTAVLKNPTQSVSAKDALGKLQKNLSGPYQILMSLPEEDGKYTVPSFFERQVMKLSPGILAVQHSNSVVILCSNLPKKELSEGKLYPQVEAVVEFAKKCSIPIGLSLPFQKLDELQIYYQQAHLAAKLCTRMRKKDMVVRPDKYMTWMSFLPAAEQYDAEAFLHPIVLKILEWDRCYHTEYLKTLREYLLTGQKKKITAQRLSIHQNTLLYRLSRINELLYIDFDDYDLLTVLLCNLLLLEVAYPSIYNAN